MRYVLGLLVSSILSAGTANAAEPEVRITEEVPYLDVSIGGEDYRIERIQDTQNLMPRDYGRTSRPCPPFCIHPMQAAEGVRTIGEIELLDFMKDVAEPGDGLLIDARLPMWFQKGTLPGSVNVPFPVLSAKDNPYQDEILRALGGVEEDGVWDYAEAKELALFCNGLWCGQAPRAIGSLLAAGYPPEKLYYYRGGLQSWLSVGLTVELPDDVPVAVASLTDGTESTEGFE